MSILAFSGFINCFLILILGIFVYLRDKSKKENQLFFLFSLALSFWQLNYGFWQAVQNEEKSLFFLRLLMVGSIFSSVFLYHLGLILLNLEGRRKKSLILLYSISFLIIILIFTPFFISKLKTYSFYSYWPQAGIVANLNIVWGLTLVVITFGTLIKNYFHLTGEKKKQIGYFILALGIAAIGGLFNLPQWYGFELYPYGNFVIFLYPLIIAFAITRYHLFNIKVILTEMLVGVMGILLLIQVFLAPTLTWRISSLAIFLFFCFLGHQLISYSHEEEKKREEAEKLAIRERALRKKAEKVANEYKRLDETKTMFLNLASHQLRTPLSSMKGYLELALSGNYGKVQGKAREFIEEVKRSNEKEINLVNDLLDLNKLQTGKLQFSFQDNVQLEDIIQEVVNEFQPEAQKYNLYLKFNKPKHPLPKITADSQKLREVILNLVDNALKYTKEGGVTISVQHNNNSRTILTIVQDTGMGMTPKEKEKLFQVFERSKDAVSTNPSGVGIGLYFASEIVKAHNGKIWAESQGKGKGSTFYVELPVK